jgi:hypothetical protein
MFVEPIFVGVDTVVDSDTYGPNVIYQGQYGVWDSAGNLVALSAAQDGSLGLSDESSYFDSDAPENSYIAYRAESQSSTSDNFLDVLSIEDADGSDPTIAWQRLGGATAAAFRVRNKTAGADLLDLADDGTLALYNDLVTDTGSTIYDYSADELTASLAAQLVTLANIDGSGGTAGQVPQTDGTASGVTWASLAAADISDVSADSVADAHHTEPTAGSGITDEADNQFGLDVAATGSVTLSGGSGTDNTGITASTSSYYDVRIMPQSAADVAASLEYDGSTIIVHVEENTTSNNPTVNYQLLEST